MKLLISMHAIFQIGLRMNNFRFQSVIIYQLLIIITIAFASCKSNNADKEEYVSVNVQEQAIVEVDTMTLSLQTFQKQILCNGRLSAIRKAELMCPKPGEILRSVNVRNGQQVKKGTLLVVADTRGRKAELNKAQHDLERARVELQDKLIGMGYDVGSASSEADLARMIPSDVLRRAEVTSGYYSARFSVESAQTQLSDCRLTAPFSGRISDLVARPHQRGDKFCTLIDDSYFDVEFRILEAELFSVQKGTMVKVSPFIAEDEVLNGIVTEVNPVVDDKGLIKIKARVKNNDGKLLDGMNVKVIVENSVPNMLIVPKEAVVERDGYHVVFLYDTKISRSVWTYVDIAYSNLTSFAITGCAKKETEIHEGDIVITSGNLNLADDTEVRIATKE